MALCLSTIQDLTNIRKLVFWDFMYMNMYTMYISVATDNLYQKFAQKVY